MEITASYVSPPTESTDAHVDCDVVLTNDGSVAETVEVAPASPLGYPYGSGCFAENPVTVGALESVTVRVHVHLTTSPANAPEVPEFTAVPVT